MSLLPDRAGSPIASSSFPAVVLTPKRRLAGPLVSVSPPVSASLKSSMTSLLRGVQSWCPPSPCH